MSLDLAIVVACVGILLLVSAFTLGYFCGWMKGSQLWRSKYIGHHVIPDNSTSDIHLHEQP